MTLKGWLKKNGFDCDVKKGEVFEYNWVDEIIYYGKVDAGGNEEWNKYMKELQLNHNYSIEIMAFLHELGHHMTINDVDDEDWDKSDIMKQIIGMMEEITPNCYSVYFRLPIESIATEWAVEFANTHKKEMRQLVRCFRRIK